MIPDSVRSLTEIEELDGDEKLIHAVSLLDFLVAISPAFSRDDATETLGAVINRHRERFSQIIDLNFALGVRNKIIHPRPANADDADLRPAAVRRAAGYVLDAIGQDVAQFVPPEVQAELVTSGRDIAGAVSERKTDTSGLYVAGWRYEQLPPGDDGSSSRSRWQAPAIELAPVQKSTNWLSAASRARQSMSPALFWGVMSCVPPALFIALLLGKKLSNLLPGNLLLHAAVLFLAVSAVRWLRAG